MAETWEEMNRDEKLDLLRRDIRRIFSALQEQDQRIRGQFGQDQARVEELVRRVGVLEQRR